MFLPFRSEQKIKNKKFEEMFHTTEAEKSNCFEFSSSQVRQRRRQARSAAEVELKKTSLTHTVTEN